MHANIIDARPNSPTTLFALEELIAQPDPREVKLSELEAKIAQIEAQLRELQKIAAAVNTIYEVEARLKSLQSFVAELYYAIKQPPNPPKPEPPPPPHENTAEAKNAEAGQPPAENTAYPPALSDTERMVLRVLYRKLNYWYGRANLKVDNDGFTVIGRDLNFGVKFSQFVAIVTRYGLSEWVIARGNDRAGYYVEIKPSDMAKALERLRELDQLYKKAISGI